MRKAISVLIVLLLTVPVFADGMLKVMDMKEYNTMKDGYLSCVKENSKITEERDLFKRQYIKYSIENTNLCGEVGQLKRDMETDKTTSKTAKYILGGLGAWGVYTFYITGGLYPVVTSCLFLYGALK